MALTLSRFNAKHQVQPLSGEPMTSRLLLSVLFAAALTLGAVLAQAASAELVSAYQAGVAGKLCEPKLDSDKSSRLGDAVQRAEQKSGQIGRAHV